MSTIQPRFTTIDGLEVRYADSGDAHEHTLLLTSPWPESLLAFERIWSRLAERARLFAVDLPGFGASERREELLAPRAMGGFLARLIAEAGLGRPHVIGPDVGTSAVLFAAADHPDQIASAVVGSGGASVPLDLGEPLRSRVLDPDLESWRRKDPREIVGSALDTVAGGLSDEVRNDYLACYDGDRYVESMRYVRTYPATLPELATLLPSITTRVTIVNGRHDPVVPVSNALFLLDRLQHARVRLIDAGHFVWEEAPVEYAETILDAIRASDSRDELARRETDGAS
jgi:pimeloyl-ACP methyl ester carboxylesterase